MNSHRKQVLSSLKQVYRKKQLLPLLKIVSKLFLREDLVEKIFSHFPELNIEELEEYIFKHHKKMYNEYVYDLYGQILSGKTSFEQIQKSIKMNQFGTSNSSFKTEREIEEKEVHYIENPLDVKEGIHQCSQCKSKRTFQYQLQTRGADEPMTTFCKCVQCGKSWRF